ncbi:MAG: VWA domain-containing protein, partial [Nocardioidaceae bacterium]
MIAAGIGPHRQGWRRATTAALVGLLTTMLAGWTVIGADSASSARAAESTGEGDGPRSMLLVLDSSGSMKEAAGGGSTRFQAATRALNTVITRLPGDLDVGLRVYGAKISDGPGSCKDSELVVPVDGVDRPALKKAVGQAEPKGNTPIAYSLKQAAKDLPEEGKRTILLVSDGEESCGGDPCQVARDLSAQGLDVRVDVIGFQVDSAARNQLTCIAQAGRGTYYDAPDARSLTNQLERLSARAARGYQPAGTPVEGTPTGDGAPELEPGQYLDTIGDGGNTETYKATVPDGGT